MGHKIYLYSNGIGQNILDMCDHRYFKSDYSVSHISVHPSMFEATALGAAMAAGSAEGVDVWDLNNMHSVPSDTYLPTISEDGQLNRRFKYVPNIYF